MMQDSFGRTIEYARISITDLCNLRCKYCMPEGVCKKSHDEILSLESIMLISDALAELGVFKQRITGGEPLVRRGVIELLKHMGANPSISKLAVTTNGQLLTEQASDLFNCGVCALNVSIDTLDENKYFELTKGGSVRKVLDGLNAAKQAGFEQIKLNAVLLKGVNDDEVYALARFAAQEHCELRFIELMPFASQLQYATQYYINSKVVQQRYKLRFLEDKTQSNKVQFFAFEDGTEVGFISPLSNKFCSECNRIRITADGKLLNCLHESVEYDLKPYLNDKNKLKEFIVECVTHKPREHHLAEGLLQQRVMENIGG